jgi:glycosyltransferase involved in cell wall biosynthesis
LEAFSRQIALPIVIIGNWKSNAYGLALLQEYADFPHIHLLDAIYEAEKINALRSSAFLYVHGHSAGGTNPSLVEAMFLGLPIFAFDCIYNRYTTENQCIYWSNVDQLYQNILKFEELGLNSIGKKMKLIAASRYTWTNIVSKYEGLFRNCAPTERYKEYTTICS